jgi:hypothetical protein
MTDGCKLGAGYFGSMSPGSEEDFSSFASRDGLLRLFLAARTAGMTQQDASDTETV